MYTGLILSHLLKPLLGDFKTVNHKFEGIKFENIVWIWCNPTFIHCKFFLAQYWNEMRWFAATNFPDKKKNSCMQKKSWFTVFEMSNLGLINPVYSISL